MHTTQLAAPRILFFGDPHGDFEPILRVSHALRPQAVILLGDIEAARPLHLELESIAELTEIWWIPGNHDTDTERSHDNLWHSELGERNLHGRVATIAGYRVAGLGGVFRGSIWDSALEISTAEFTTPAALKAHMKPRERWRTGISLRHRSSIFPSDYLHLLNARADILVTHEGLGGAMHGQPALERLAARMGVTLAVHGHLHRDIDYIRDGLLDRASPFKAFGVNKGSHLRWPPVESASRPVGTATEQAQVDDRDGGVHPSRTQAAASRPRSSGWAPVGNHARGRIDHDAVLANTERRTSRRAAPGQITIRQVQA